MNIKIDSLIPFDALQTGLEHVFSVVEKTVGGTMSINSTTQTGTIPHHPVFAKDFLN